jgi:hypothetical protein
MPEHRADFRCPVYPHRLLAKTVAPEDAPKVVPDNLIEFACYDCARALRDEGNPVRRVLHRFNLLGECVETIEVPLEH